MEDKPLSRPVSLLRWTAVILLSWVGIFICGPLSLLAWLVNNLSGAIADLAVFLNSLIRRATIALLLRKEQLRKEQHGREDEEQAD